MTLDEQRKRAEEIAEEIGRLREQINVLQREAEPLLLALAEARSKFKVGQVISQEKLIGYGNQKRTLIERARVARILSNGHIIVTRIKKDGTLGKTRRLWDFEVSRFKAEDAEAQS
jgi:hypothetical protein